MKSLLGLEGESRDASVNRADARRAGYLKNYISILIRKWYFHLQVDHILISFA